MKNNKKLNERSFFERDYTGKLISEETPFAVKEAYKMLRTNLIFTARAEKSPVYVVTSAHAKAGKSVTASNVAYSFSLIGKKVLLVDGDLRFPAVCKIFGFEDSKEKGFSNLLASNTKNISEYIIKTKYENLDILPSGPLPPNPSELLSFEYVGELFEEFKKDYDIIIVDMPPVGEVTDAVLLSPYVTGYILVIRSEVTRRASISEAVETIEKNHGRICGFVLNEVNLKSKLYGSKYKYDKKGYYNHYYSYSEYRREVDVNGKKK